MCLEWYHLMLTHLPSDLNVKKKCGVIEVTCPHSIAANFFRPLSTSLCNWTESDNFNFIIFLWVYQERKKLVPSCLFFTLFSLFLCCTSADPLNYATLWFECVLVRREDYFLSLSSCCYSASPLSFSFLSVAPPLILWYSLIYSNLLHVSNDHFSASQIWGFKCVSAST